MELGSIDLVIIIVGIIVGFYYWSTATHNHWKRLNVPGPKPLPLVGNFGSFYFGQKAFADIHQQFYKEWKREPFYGIYNARLPTLMVTDPELIRHILIKDFNVFNGRGININENDPLAHHLFNIEGHEWKVLRSKLTPAFTTGKLKHMIDLMIECADHYEKFLKDQIGSGKVLESRELAAKFTTDVIGSCAFGINMNAIGQEDSQFRIIGRKIFEPTIWNMVKRLMSILTPGLFRFLGLQTLSNEHTNFFINSIKETIKFRLKEKIVRHDLVDMLIDIKRHQNEIDFELTEALLASQAFVFFAAGFETSSTTISFALYELATVPETQEKLRTEIIETLAKHNGQISYEVINEMKYLNMVLQETLRKNPPVILLQRKSIQPYEVPGSDVTLPTGTRVFIPVYSIHHDEQYFPNPELFDPERFDEDDKKHSMTNLPFGDGPKNCIGARFAAYQSKLGLICILKHFKVSPSQSTKVPYEIDKAAIVLSVSGGINLKFEPLNTK